MNKTLIPTIIVTLLVSLSAQASSICVDLFPLEKSIIDFNIHLGGENSEKFTEKTKSEITDVQNIILRGFDFFKADGFFKTPRLYRLEFSEFARTSEAEWSNGVVPVARHWWKSSAFFQRNFKASNAGIKFEYVTTEATFALGSTVFLNTITGHIIGRVGEVLQALMRSDEAMARSQILLDSVSHQVSDPNRPRSFDETVDKAGRYSEKAQAELSDLAEYSGIHYKYHQFKDLLKPYNVMFQQFVLLAFIEASRANNKGLFSLVTKFFNARKSAKVLNGDYLPIQYKPLAGVLKKFVEAQSDKAMTAEKWREIAKLFLQFSINDINNRINFGSIKMTDSAVVDRILVRARLFLQN